MLCETFIRTCGVPDATPGSIVTRVKFAILIGAVEGTVVVVFSS